MAQPPPPDWGKLDERDLEYLFCGDNEEDARLALDELWRRHEKDLRAKAVRWCSRDQDMANDAMQELRLRVWQRRRQYQPDRGRWIKWAEVILRNIVVDLFRKRARFLQSPAAPPGDEGSARGSLLDRIPGREPEADRNIKLQELQEAMTDCLQRLPPEEREALVLQVLEDRNLEEIADEGHVPRGTAGSRVYRARAKMRACLKKKGYNGGEV